MTWQLRDESVWEFLDSDVVDQHHPETKMSSPLIEMPHTIKNDTEYHPCQPLPYETSIHSPTEPLVRAGVFRSYSELDASF